MASEQQVMDAFSQRDKERAVALLSTVRVQPSTIRDDDNRTLLHRASGNNWPDVCKLLVDRYQLDPHCGDSAGYTALHWACYKNNHEVVRYLVQYCCSDPLGENNNGLTPLDWSSGESRKFLQEIIAASKKQLFSNVVSYLKYQKAIMKATKKAEAIFDEAMSEGSGELSQCNILFHGAPGAGKSSVKCLILGQPPRPKHKQNATDIIEKSVRTVCVSRVANSSNHFTEVDNDDLLNRIVVEVEKHRKSTKNKEELESVSNRSKPQQQDVDFIKEATQTTVTHSQPSVNLQHAEDDGQPTANESTATEESIIEKLANIQLFSSGNVSVECSVFDSCWFHHIDSSGQPQFLDVFPLLYNSPSHCVVVMRLTEGLDTRPKVRFYSKGKDEYCLPDQLVLSNREMIIRMCQIAQSIAQAMNGKFVPRVFVVGTYLDKVLPLIGRIRLNGINEELLRIHQLYSDVLVCKVVNEQVAFNMNAMAVGENRLQYTEELQRCILSATEKMSTPVKVPLKWMTFHLELDKVEEGVFRIRNCFEVGKKLKMTEEKVRVALEFLNKVALILYYPNDVPDLVLTKMDPFTNRLSRLIKASFIPPDNEPTKECDELREKGVFRKSFLRRVFADLDESLLSDEEFLKLLVRLKIAVNINGDLYFLPSALSLKRPSKRSSFKCQSNPLALLWDGLILPHGFFLTVCVEMQDKSEGGYVFELRTDIAQWRGEIQLSEVKQKIPGVVKLTDQQRWIQVSYSGDKSYCPAVYDVVTRATQRAIERLKHTGIGSPTIGCVCNLCKKKDHFCYLSDNKKIVTCSINKSKTGPVTEDILCWLEGISLSANCIPEDADTTADDNGNGRSPISSKGDFDDEQEKDISLTAVLIQHTPELLGVVSDVDSLVADLTSAGIISENDVSGSTGDEKTHYQRVKVVVDAVQSCLVKSSTPEKVLVKFSSVLKNQSDETLKRISVDIRGELVLSCSPDPDDMFEVLENKASRWEDIGRKLRVSFDHRQSLQKEGILSSDSNKLERVLRKWVESKCSDVSWRHAIRVFRLMQFNDVIESTRQFLRREDILNKYLPVI